jgi:cold shock CspA family protein
MVVQIADWVDGREAPSQAYRRYPRIRLTEDLPGERRCAPVAFFKALQGYGFINDPELGHVFLHYSVLDQPGYRMVREGEMVNYLLMRNGSRGNGLYATYACPV